MFPRCVHFPLACLAGFCLLAAPAVQSAEPKPLAPQAMHLLKTQCLSCHNPEKHKGGLDMTSPEKFAAGTDSGPVLNSSNPAESLFLKVLAAEADPHMPPKKQLSAAQIALFKEWAAAGAPWDAAALAEASAERKVRLEPLPAGYHPALALALSPDGTKLALARGNHLLVHDLNSTNATPTAQVQAHVDLVRSLAWSPDGNILASGSYREIKLWQADTLTLQHQIASNLAGRITALRFSPHGGALLAGDSLPAEAGWLRIFSTESLAELAAWQGHADMVNDLSLSADGGFLASASSDKTVKLWELVSRKEVAQIEAHSDSVLGAAFNNDASQLLTISSDKQLKLWDVPTRLSAVTIGPRSYGFSALAWSADSAFAVAGTDDGRLIRFSKFKVHTGAQSSETAEERTLGNWEDAIQAVTVNADGTRFAAASEDGTVYLVDRDGKLLRKFAPETATPSSPSAPSPSFVRDVLPVMAKAGCMAGACHAKAEGQNGFKLSVFSFDPKSDFAEIVKDGRGRRVLAAAPEESLLLLKPTLALEHGGGQRIEPGSETYQVLLDWIRGGMVYQHPNEPVLARVSVEPHAGSYQPNQSVQLALTAHYSDGSSRDVTELADFVSNDKEIAKVSESGVVTVGTIEGEGVIVARYMGYVDASRITIPSRHTLPESLYAALRVNNYIDRLAYAQFQRLGLFPSGLASDSEFLRRSSLDTIGTLPRPEQVRAFLADADPGKRKRWIEELLDHPAYADYWANKWTDLLRPNPDLVGVKSIFFLDQWIRESFRVNKPYDQFVREILLAEGSNHQEGPATIYRDRREPQDRTTIVGQLFLGVRMECAKCHHHPTEKWTQDDFYQLAAFFGPVKQKGAGLSPPISAGRETFYFAAGGSVKHPVTGEAMQPRPLEARDFAVPQGADPRRALADWMTNPENPYFARAAVNRVWAAFFGRGLVEPVDDFRISNPVVNEPLLDALAGDFVRHGYDLKHVMRTIMNSRLYQLSSTPGEHNLTDTKNFSRSYRRRLPAEVLLDAVNDLTGTRDEFNGCPPGTRAIQTWSYKVRSHFMDAFGRPNPSSDCPCERDLRSSVVQSLHMMNSQALQTKLASAEGRVHQLAESKLAPAEIVTELYLAAFSRFPSDEELAIATAAYGAKDATRQSATEDILWALLNSPEFVFNH